MLPTDNNTLEIIQNNTLRLYSGVIYLTLVKTIRTEAILKCRVKNLIFSEKVIS